MQCNERRAVTGRGSGKLTRMVGRDEDEAALRDLVHALLAKILTRVTRELLGAAGKARVSEQ